MGEIDNIIKAIETKMEICKNKFNENEQIIGKILEQSKELQQQYDNADQRREQLRGEYTGYVNLIKELKANNPIPVNVVNSESDKIKENKDDSIEQKAETETSLSVEEVAKVKEITKAKATKKATKKEEPELPDYLKG